MTRCLFSQHNISPLSLDDRSKSPAAVIQNGDVDRNLHTHSVKCLRPGLQKTTALSAINTANRPPKATEASPVSALSP